MQRFFVKPQAIHGDRFLIDDIRLVHQISRVLRMQKGEKIILLDNLGSEFLGEISEISKKEVIGSILKHEKKEEKIKRKLILFQSLLKKDNFELVLQKCTELGVFAFQPIITERAIKIKEEVPARWHDIAREAAEQSERIFIPEIFKPLKFIEAVKSINKHDASFLAYERGTSQTLSAALLNLDKKKTINLFVGPEGGFSEKEVGLARENGLILVGLGELILRSETAGIVASSLVLLT